MSTLNTPTMTREELVGKQTPGEAYVEPHHDGVYYGNITVQLAPRIIQTITCQLKYAPPIQQAANAALYAEAHNVANETGMWPKDLLDRVKELEEALDTLTLVVGLTPIAGNKDALQEAMNTGRAILNKKP